MVYVIGYVLSDLLMLFVLVIPNVYCFILLIYSTANRARRPTSVGFAVTGFGMFASSSLATSASKAGGAAIDRTESAGVR